MSHTPGPWNFSDLLTASENHRGWGIYVSGKWIADVSPMNNKHGNPSGEGYANVSLIAAAPELLEALCRAINVLHATGAQDEANQARAAISKATGEPQ